MRTFQASSYTIGAAAAIAMLAGCSGGSSQLSPATVGKNTGLAIAPSPYQSILQGGPRNAILALRRGSPTGRTLATPSFFNRDATGKPLIFVSDFSNNVVNIYLQVGKNEMVGQITGVSGPEDLATDTAANLYVAATEGSHILVYGPPYTGPPKLILNDAGYFPQGVSVSPRGIVAVANVCTSPGCPFGSGNFTFYAKNSTTPCATVADPINFAAASYDTFDDRGDLYIDGVNGSHESTIGEITGGCNARKITVLTTKNSIISAFNIHTTKSDRIAVLDNGTSGTAVIYTYESPKTGTLGSPVSTTPLTTISNYVTAFSFVASGAGLYTGEEYNSSSGFANGYDYPVGGAPEKTIATANQTPLGVAVTPPLIP